MVADIVPEWTDVPESAEPPELPRIAISRRGEFEIAIIAAAAVAASFLSGDARAAIIVGSLGLAAVGTRLIDRHVTFSFGEGFVGYRSDLDGRAGSRRTTTSTGTGNGAHPVLDDRSGTLTQR